MSAVTNKEAALRDHARLIFAAAVKAADPVEAVLRRLRVEGDALIAGEARFELSRFRRIRVIGAGKAGATMAQAVERALDGRVEGGLVNVKYGHVAPVATVELKECAHPVPDQAGVDGAKRIAAMARDAAADDLLLCVISGGGSALLPLPAAPVTLEEKQRVTGLLLECGATIHEINAVRKHISEVKGGQLSRLAFPATVISLLLSDVIGDNLDVIGSGPTAPDASTWQTARDVLNKFGIWERVPAVVRDRIDSGLRGGIGDTPKSGDATLARTHNLVVGSNLLAVEAAAVKARELGYQAVILSTFIEGETREVARMHAAIAKQTVRFGQPVEPPVCLISGGETTVTLCPGHGTGGRNQEFALAAALDIAGLENVVILSGGTDGTDGPTDAAGALADGFTVTRAAALGLSAKDALARHDAYPFFDALGDLLKTGPTNTNVMDVRLVLAAN